MKGKLFYVLSVALVTAGMMLALAPNVPRILSVFDDRTIVIASGGALVYIGVVLLFLVKLRERRQRWAKRDEKIFIMCASSDKDKVIPIAEELKSLGFDIWFDELNILPGQVIQEQYEIAIDECVAAILFISSSLSSPVYDMAIEVFMNKNKIKGNGFVPLVPVIMDDSDVPDKIKNIMFVRYDDNALLEKITRSLTVMLKL